MPVDVTARKGTSNAPLQDTKIQTVAAWNKCVDYVSRPKFEEKITQELTDDFLKGVYVSGFPGVGKTTVVKTVISNIKERFEDVYYIDLPVGIEGGIEVFLLFVAREIEKTSTYELDKNNIESSFLSFISLKRVCLIFDDFDAAQYSDFLQFISHYDVRSQFVIVSRYSISFFQSELIRKDSSVNLADLFSAVVISEFSEEEVQSLIKKRYTRKRLYSSPMIAYIKQTIQKMGIKHPYELTLVLSYFENNIEDGDTDYLDDFCIQLDDMNTMNMILTIVDKIWLALSNNAKTFIYFISFFKGGANITSLVRHSEQIRKMRSVLNELEKHSLIYNSGRGIYLTNTLIRYALENLAAEGVGENRYQDFSVQARALWMDTCHTIVSTVGDCFNDLDRLHILDSVGGVEYVRGVVKWCVEEKDYERALEIIRAASYYFYVRGETCNIADSLEMLRYRCAKALGNTSEMFVGLCLQLNVLSKRGQTKEAKEILGLIEQLDYLPDEDPKILIKYKHARALYYFSDKNYDQAYEIWSTLYEIRNTLDKKDTGTVSRWLCICMQKMGRPAEEVLRYLRDTCQFARENNLSRDLIKCNILIIEILLQLNKVSEQDSKEYFDLLDEAVAVGDTSYLAHYYYIEYKLLMYLFRAEEAMESLKLALEYYEAVFDIAMCNTIRKILGQDYQSI